MSSLRHLRIPRTSIHARVRRSFTTTNPRLAPSATTTQPNIQYTPACPSPSCACTPPPSVANLDIDRTSPLLHTKPQYAQHLVLCTGKDDWTSRVEDEEGVAGDIVRGLKGEIGRGSPGFDPFNNILTTLSSFPPSPPSASPSSPPQTTPTTTTLLLFPSFTQHTLPLTISPKTLSTFATSYLKTPAAALHASHAALPPHRKAALTRDPSLATLLPAPTPITTPVVLICGHNARDARCGILGPLLRDKFDEVCRARGIEGVRVGTVSHIGGHKFAGNVILYIPESWSASPPTTAATSSSSSGPAYEAERAKGRGIWYGRVGLEHVEGVVEETLVKGRVIGELLRGGVLEDGSDLARVLEARGQLEKGGEGEGEGKLMLRPRARG